jgi:hypothetical protein
MGGTSSAHLTADSGQALRADSGQDVLEVHVPWRQQPGPLALEEAVVIDSVTTVVGLLTKFVAGMASKEWTVHTIPPESRNRTSLLDRLCSLRPGRSHLVLTRVAGEMYILDSGHSPFEHSAFADHSTRALTLWGNRGSVQFALS